MSVSIKWQAIKGKRIDGTSSLLLAIAGTRDSIELDASDIRFLEGIAAGNPSVRESIDELIEAINKHERIRVWGDY